MSNPFVGEIRMFGGSFAPTGWAFCDGSLLPISENQALFQLVGTTYGGDGQSTFALPDLRGRIPVHQGNGAVVGDRGGVETVTLGLDQIPSHTHALVGTNADGDRADPAGAFWAQSDARPYSAATTNLEAMHIDALKRTGGDQPHDNMLPFGCVSYIISLFGIFPSQT